MAFQLALFFWLILSNVQIVLSFVFLLIWFSLMGFLSGSSAYVCEQSPRTSWLRELLSMVSLYVMALLWSVLGSLCIFFN